MNVKIRLELHKNQQKLVPVVARMVMRAKILGTLYSRERFTNLGKLNSAPAASKNDALLKSGQN